MSKPDYVGRFEVVGQLYYAATGRLRPGKDHPFHDSSDPENVSQFDAWLATHGYLAALDKILDLEQRLAKADEELEQYR